MCAKILKSNPEKTKKWSGGDTTELFISPKNSSYVKRDFDFRISTATVEVEESVFTALPSVSRVLMVLEGQMNLIHENQHKTELNKFGVDRFEGGWRTASFGTCTDFNLMLRNGYVGSVEGIDLNANMKVKYDFDERPALFFYAYKGKVTVALNDEELSLEQGDLLCLEESECFLIELSSNADASVVVVQVK